MKLNLFVLDYNPVLSAQMHHDGHLETQARDIITLLRAVQADKHPLKNYILTKWAEHAPHFTYARKLAQALIAEQQFRFGYHNEELFDSLHLIDDQKSDKLAVRFVQLVPQPIAGDPVKAYQKYYSKTYAGASWTKRQAPVWWSSSEQLALNLYHVTEE